MEGLNNNPTLMIRIQTDLKIKIRAYAAQLDVLADLSKPFSAPPPRSHKSITAKLVLAEVHDE